MHKVYEKCHNICTMFCFECFSSSLLHVVNRSAVCVYTVCAPALLRMIFFFFFFSFYFLLLYDAATFTECAIRFVGFRDNKQQLDISIIHTKRDCFTVRPRIVHSMEVMELYILQTHYKQIGNTVMVHNNLIIKQQPVMIHKINK